MKQLNKNMKLYSLVKRIDRYDLYDELRGHKIASTLDGCDFKLSLKNCQAIELGYDLEELAYSCFPNGTYETSEIDLALDMYKKGFQKALELLGDKKYSEDNLLQAIEIYHGEGKTLIEIIKSLQQTEWDVDIVMEDTFVSNQGLGYNEFVTCRVLKIEGNNVYGEYIKGTKTNLDVPFSLSALNDIEGNSIGKPKLDTEGCLILNNI